MAAGVGARALGATYVGSGAGVCKINAGCFNDPQTCGTCQAFWPYNKLVTGVDDSAAEPADNSIPGASSANLEFGGTWTIVASPTDPHIVYHAFTKREVDAGANELDQVDVWANVLTWDGAGGFQGSQPVQVTDPTAYNDSRDQLQPALTATREGLVYVSWYDRRYDGGVAGCAGNLNRCYIPNRSISFDHGASWAWTRNIPVDAGNPKSDPALLPGRCAPNPNERFLGDYHIVNGDVLHSFHSVVGAPENGAVAGTLTRGWVSGGYWWW